MNPTALTVHQKSRVLDIAFDDGREFSLPFELLRVYSPSAEVRGHGQGQEVLQVGKREVGITGVEPVGNYAIQPTFTDGHNTGLFSWDYLYKLGSEQQALWADYLARLHAAGFDGDSGRAPGATLAGATPAKGCGHKH
ncbi:MAG: gamma-butyrobetaine hydroxylase-like domain-containing protein [Massilia sp.]